jgi:hypothetical protein
MGFTVRKIENLHIVFWLLKDASWAANFKLGGLLMIIPTIAIAIYIVKISWHQIAERFHNLAVLSWISANSLWMIGEFFGWDEKPPHLRTLALLPFGIGILLLLYYYFIISPKQKKQIAAESIS